MKIKYYLLDPTGNKTVLVDTPVDRKDYCKIAARLMELEPTAEQVGFLGDSSLCMAGGEFCGNATMSAAAIMCMKNGMSAGGTKTVQLKVSGASDKVDVSVTADSDGVYFGTVCMPEPECISIEELEFENKKYSLPVVRFSGIYHIISENVLDKSISERAVKKWCADLKCDALGIMLLDINNHKLDPLVYVPNPETSFWESSCASGTSAVGAYVAYIKKQPVELSLREPGGTLTVFAEGKTVKLSGSVKIIKEKAILFN